jgi:hypothetical protein
MASVDTYNATLSISLLDGSTTAMSSPGSAQSGSVGEAFASFPRKIAGGVSELNVKLGSVTNPLILGVWGQKGLSFKIEQSGSAIAAYPFACLSDIDSGLGISEIWVTNTEATEKTLNIVAVE